MSASEKCSRFGWCEPMRESLNPMNSEGKGLSTMVGWPNEAPQGVRAQLLGVVYRPKAKAQGFVLNTCPWCGEKVKFWPETARPAPTEPEEESKAV